MARTHLTRKELREDALQEAGRSAFEYFSHHRHQIITTVLAILAGMALIFGISNYLSRQKADAQQRLFDARNLYQDAAMKTDPAQRDSLLDDTIQECQALVDDHSSSPIGLEALYTKGNAQYMKGEYDTAIETFESYIQKSPTPSDKTKGRVAIAYAIENKTFDQNLGNEGLDQAREAYAKAGKHAPVESYLKYQAMLGEGRVLTQMGRLDEAEKVYQAVEKARPFHEDEEIQNDWNLAGWGAMSRMEKAETIRRMLIASKANASFENLAKEKLEEIEARTQGPAPR